MVLSKLRNNHFLSFAGNVIVSGMGFCIYAVLAHNLSSKEEVGYWAFFIMNVTLAEIFRTGFLQNSLIKFYSGTDPRRSFNIAGSTWYIGFYITALACVINLAFYLFYPANGGMEMHSLIYWFGITFLSTLPFNVALWILQAEGRFGIILYIRIINQGMLIAAIVALIVLGPFNLYYNHLRQFTIQCGNQPHSCNCRLGKNKNAATQKPLGHQRVVSLR